MSHNFISFYCSCWFYYFIVGWYVSLLCVRLFIFVCICIILFLCIYFLEFSTRQKNKITYHSCVPNFQKTGNFSIFHSDSFSQALSNDFPVPLWFSYNLPTKERKLLSDFIVVRWPDYLSVKSRHHRLAKSSVMPQAETDPQLKTSQEIAPYLFIICLDYSTTNVNRSNEKKSKE